MNKHCLPVILIALLAGANTNADVLVLSDGRTLSGSYFGGTSGTVRFQTEAGVETFPTAEVLALEFTGTSVAPSASPTPSPTPSVTPEVVTIPQNTTILVSLLQELSTQRVRTGDPFRARLEANIVVDGVLVAPIGTQVTGRVDHAEQAKRIRGSSQLSISLTSLMTNGEMNSIATSNFADRGAPAAAAAVKGAAAGAAVGAVIDGSSGAGTGAAAGATLGALKKGDAIVIPRGRLLEFTMKAPAPVKVQKQ